jgi:alpha-ketoglutarate-dependent taurine dioxygenase
MPSLQFKTARVNVAPHSLVKPGYLSEGATLPLVIKPAVRGIDLISWAKGNRGYLETEILKHGAILFRDFSVREVDEFGQFVNAVSGELMTYRERSSPRHEVGDRIYTSTDYPPEQKIFPHNEHSYAVELPLRLYFFCKTPAERGGETPIADTRKILKRIDPGIVERFREKRYMYVRNFGDGLGVPWQTAFQTEDKATVEEYCRRNAIEFEWKSANRLKTRQVRPALARHPRSGEDVWFNHATFFHVSTLDVATAESLVEEFADEGLPHNTYYGDGSPIELSVLDELRAAYLQEIVSFPWQERDILMLDNMLCSHARNSYSGARQILVAMSDRYTRTDLN